MIKCFTSISGKKLYKRNLYLNKIKGFYEDTEMIKVITGIRRCGKSCIMLSIVDDLLSSGVGMDQIIYINLDTKENLEINNPEKLRKVIDNKTQPSKINYLFIDEVQNVENFEKLLNAYREEDNYSIFITGSNSYLLSSEISTKLTGRYLTFEVFTLNFHEYLEMKESFKFPLETTMQEFNKFMLEGGFPRCIFYNNTYDKHTYLSNVLQEIFYKDVQSRVRINNIETFNAVKDFVINNAGSPINLVNIWTELKKSGVRIKQQTVSRYIQILLNAKIIYECKNFDLKSKKSLASNKKYYLADTSLYFALNPNQTRAFGQMLENITYLYARSKTYNLNVGKIGNLECDFILKDKMGSYSYAQVATTILSSLDTENREYRPLEKIQDNYPKYVLSMDTLEQKRNGIIHKNIASFMKNSSEFSL